MSVYPTPAQKLAMTSRHIAEKSPRAPRTPPVCRECSCTGFITVTLFANSHAYSSRTCWKCEGAWAAYWKKPFRVQLRRTRGWRKPEGVIVCARPHEWGNPYVVMFDPHSDYSPQTPLDAVRMFAKLINKDEGLREAAVKRLRGHSLACWCRLDQPCHVDVLLHVVNAMG